MATKRKSIIEEALLEAKTLEDALKANTKEMLASHMKQEIENIVETSLKEEDVNDEGSDEDKENEVPVTEQEDVESLEVITGDDSDEEEEDELTISVDDSEFEEEGSELEDIDLDLDALAGVGDEEIDVVDIPIDLGDEDEIDLTASSDEEVLTVFKAMGDEDEVEVIKDGDGIHLTDNETGAEYYIRESEQLEEDDLCEDCGDDVVYEIEMDEHQSFPDRRKEKRSMDKYWGDTPDDFKKHLSHSDQGYNDRMDDSLEEDDEELYEGGMYTDDQGGEDYPNFKDTDPGYDGTDGSSHGEQGGKDFSRKGRSQKTRHDHEEHLEEDRTQNNAQSGPYGGGRQRYGGQKAGTSYANSAVRGESRKSRRPISNKRKEARNVRKVSDSKIMKEYKELKSKNEEYKGALNVFKDKLNEVALFNTNLAYVNRLFTEHSTTKKEKMNILQRFDGAESVKNSKTIYKTIKGELEGKTPINESVENKVNRTVKSSASDLNESTAYVDPQIVAIKDLMKRIS